MDQQLSAGTLDPVREDRAVVVVAARHQVDLTKDNITLVNRSLEM